MKKVKLMMMALVMSLAFVSCKKEEVKPSEPAPVCNCGIITSDGIDGNCYWLEIRNNCSNNKKTFCFDYDVWLDGNLGEEFCVSNVTSW